MTTYALALEQSAPVELPSGRDIEVGDVIFSYETMTRWTDAERAAYGIYPIVDDAIPEGKVATGSTLELDGDVVARRWVLTDAPPYVAPVPQSISDRQFAQVLAMDGLITEEDALAWVKVGTVPAPLQALVDAIPDPATQFSANMLLGGATEFDRNHPMTEQLGAGLQMTAEQIDEIWRLGATL